MVDHLAETIEQVNGSGSKYGGTGKLIQHSCGFQNESLQVQRFAANKQRRERIDEFDAI